MEQITYAYAVQGGGPGSPVFRYDLVDRAARCLARQSATLLAWGFGTEGLQLVVEGAPADVGEACRGLRVGTTHAARRRGLALDAELARAPVHDLQRAVVEAHRGPVAAGAAGPLASPWSSHRDLLDFRRAPFYDAAPLARRCDPRALHAAAGGRPLPSWPPPLGAPEDLSLLLRIAGAVLGVLPADRRCFRLFVHLARARGWGTAPVADALALTRRRVRQLAEGRHPVLPVALLSLGDPRLACVP